jgi:hypothetical protein
VPTTRNASDPAPVTQDFRYLIYYVWSELPPAEKGNSAYQNIARHCRHCSRGKRATRMPIQIHGVLRSFNDHSFRVGSFRAGRHGDLYICVFG